ncbi:MAG: NAD(P)/FAD-dependent oxidoreductase [Saprospiraceae bacterium]|nr:NAD(P)/FAD-dependent oxidoreductase [Saprospiraceae bacterium]
MKQTDVCIVGAGPGGIATALKLSELGISCVLLEKDSFPRDKICGDAISGKTTTLLNRLDPQIQERFKKIQTTYTKIWGIRFVAPNLKNVDIPFFTEYNPQNDPAPGYVCRRTDFDNFLAEEAKRSRKVDFLENYDVQEINPLPKGGYEVKSGGDLPVIHTRLLIVANGAQSKFSRKQAGIQKDLKHYAGGVRAYYQNVSGWHPHQFIEIHYIQDVLPGYLWIFPLPNGHANVGLGMRSDKIAANKLNLRKILDEVMHTHPIFKERFAKAERIGPVRGFGLPLGSKTYPISGQDFMLVGDAAHLVDPMSGEGIGNAIYSGFIAAEQARDCLLANDFSAQFMRNYDIRIKRVLGDEMKVSYNLQRFLTKPFVPNFLANLILKKPQIIQVLSRMYTDLELRRKVVLPGFWLKVLLNRYDFNADDTKKQA